MKPTLTGKAINEFAKQNERNLPYRINEKYYPDGWHGKERKTDGNFFARKYKAILELIKETEANVFIKDDAIDIHYSNGFASIKRDLLIDKFLIPLI